MDKNNSKEEIDLVSLLNLIWESKKIIIATTTIFSIVAVIYSLSLPDIYESEALLSPVNEDIAYYLGHRSTATTELIYVRKDNETSKKMGRLLQERMG